jgi:hypothetical protein
MNKINNLNKMSIAHSGTMACPIAQPIALQAKEPEFLQLHGINK